MAIGSDDRVEVNGFSPGFLADHRNPGKLLDVDLVADASPRGHDAHVLKRALRPLEEGVALAVALEFELHVLLESGSAPRFVCDHRMVDHQIAGYLRVDLCGVAAERGHGLAHNREVDEHRNAGEILQKHAGGTVRELFSHFARKARLNDPRSRIKRLLVGLRASQDVFKQDRQRERQLFRIGDRSHRIVGVRLVADGKLGGAGGLVLRHRLVSPLVSTVHGFAMSTHAVRHARSAMRSSPRSARRRTRCNPLPHAWIRSFAECRL